jgi:hypothetical protein
MTPLKIALAGTAMFVLLIMFATRPAPAPEPPAEPVVRAIPTEPILQPVFDTPSWVPDEATKRKALMRAYHMNGGSMVGDHMIDVSQQEGIVTADAPAHAEVDVVDPNERNALDAQAEEPTKGRSRVKLAHRSEAKPEDTCAKHGMYRVEYRKTWRCRK